MPNDKTDQLIAAMSGQIALDAAKDTILAEAERTGTMWLPRIDPQFLRDIRSAYSRTGATPTTVDAVLAVVGADSERSGMSPALAWVTAFQAIVALETVAKSDGALGDDDHSLLAHFRLRQSETP